jgi:hypothetical protein
MTYVCLPGLGIIGRHLPLKTAAHSKQGSAHHWKFSKVHTGPRFAHSFHPSVCIRLYNKIVQATSRSHENKQVRGIEQAEASVENIRGLNLTVVKLMTVQVSKLPLQQKMVR